MGGYFSHSFTELKNISDQTTWNGYGALFNTVYLCQGQVKKEGILAAAPPGARSPAVAESVADLSNHTFLELVRSLLLE